MARLKALQLAFPERFFGRSRMERLLKACG
jgi:hypothetical protein